MLQTITTADHYLLSYIKDDPVRPEIPPEFRVDNGRFICALVDSDQPKAIVCVSLHDTVPTTVEDLYKTSSTPSVAIFYTIWSYAPGSGRELLLMATKDIATRIPSVSRFVTLSPKTEMAKRFHLKNGAFILQENSTTVNYEYQLRVS